MTLLAASASLLSSLWLAREFEWLQHLPSFLYVTLFFVLLTTIIVFRYLYRLKQPAYFIQLYLFLMVVKLIAYLGYNIFMVLKDKPSAVSNVVFFLLVYFVFTLIEIIFLYRQVNAQKPS